jgi:hypothetical protein
MRAGARPDGRSPKLAAFAAQNDPLDRFARLAAVAAHLTQ